MTVVKSNNAGNVAQAGDLLRTVARLHGELQRRDLACCDVQSSTQCQILTTLGREGDQTLAALTRRLNLDKAWLSRSTDELVTQGLLEKAPHPTDRRALLLHLTPAGQQACQALDAQLNAQSSRVLARLPAGQQAAALTLLEQLSAALQAELGSGEGAGC
ncbi:MarR family winged helix-turn-helix transcriptional regulator [Deinococcus sp. UYEF24]